MTIKTFRIKWPLTAVLFWLLMWVIYYVLLDFNISQYETLLATTSIGIIVSYLEKNRWRRLILIVGFIASWVLTKPVSATEHVPAWLWLLPLVTLLITYPVQSWSDAPLFPTPHKVLEGLNRAIILPIDAKILDAGCGLGHGLRELRREYPQSQLFGVERSWLLTKICAFWCKWARIQRGDIWQLDWSMYDMVYIFQRPESMKKTQHKVSKELKPKAWLVSLEFEITDCVPTQKILVSNGKMLWMYQMPLQTK